MHQAIKQDHESEDLEVTDSNKAFVAATEHMTLTLRSSCQEQCEAQQVTWTVCGNVRSRHPVWEQYYK